MKSKIPLLQTFKFGYRKIEIVLQNSDVKNMILYHQITISYCVPGNGNDSNFDKNTIFFPQFGYESNNCDTISGYQGPKKSQNTTGNQI